MLGYRYFNVLIVCLLLFGVVKMSTQQALMEPSQVLIKFELSRLCFQLLKSLVKFESLCESGSVVEFPTFLYIRKLFQYVLNWWNLSGPKFDPLFEKE